MADIEEYIPRMFPRWDTGELVEIRYPKEALEQSAQEPVELEETLKHCDGKDCECYAYYQGECSCDVDWTPEEVVKLRYQLNNTHPHQWQGLTDDEIVDWFEECFGHDEISETTMWFAKRLLDAVKEKNHVGAA